MKSKLNDQINRRSFLWTTALLSVGLSKCLASDSKGLQEASTEEDLHIIGPKEGFSPQIGTLVSMMTWMRHVVLSTVENLDLRELDYLHDSKANTIGALLAHLAALERQYQATTLGSTAKSSRAVDWEAALVLGERARKAIKGNSIDFYMELLNETRAHTYAEFKKRDDSWLAKVDPTGFGNQPTNNFCKWFHVCEHESNHNGQIKWIRNRIPRNPDSGN